MVAAEESENMASVEAMVVSNKYQKFEKIAKVFGIGTQYNVRLNTRVISIHSRLWWVWWIWWIRRIWRWD